MKTKLPSYFSTSKPNERSERLTKITKLINIFDSICAGRVVRLQGLEKEIVGIRDGKESLRRAKKHTTDLEQLIISSKKLRRAYQAQSLLKLIVVCYFLLGLAITMEKLNPSGISSYMGSVFISISDVVLTPRVISFMVTLGGGFLVLRQYTNKKLKQLFSSRSAQHIKEWKEIVQDYVHLLSREIRSSKADPSDFKFRIYHDDYDGIEIVNTPSILADFFIAKVRIE